MLLSINSPHSYNSLNVARLDVSEATVRTLKSNTNEIMEPTSKEKPISGEEPGSTLRQLSTMLSTDNSSLLEAALAPYNATTSITTGMSKIGISSSAAARNSLKFDEVYTKEQRLQAGSYGTVYTCRHKHKPEITYAVKIMDRHKLKRNDVDNFFRELTILNELTQAHTNGTPWHAIQLIDFFFDPSSLYMVQVFAAGGDVFERLCSRDHYTEKDARGLALNLIQSIQFLHTFDKPIVHRDVKPENLLLLDNSSDTQILLADFGFARHLGSDEDRCHTRCGTPAYICPEILLGLPYAFSVDMWSIGCVIFMLLAGYTPFKAENHRELFRKIRAGDFIFHDTSWNNVSIQAKQLITHLLKVNVSKRWTADQALQCDWFNNVSDAQLAKHDLTNSLEEIKRFDAKGAWKRAVNALGFCAAAPFWKPDVISFEQQMVAWDTAVVAAAVTTTSSEASSIPRDRLMSKLPRVKFADRYKMKWQLRKGKSATVWVCEHKPTGTVYAVKVIQRAGLQPKDDEAVLNEVAVMQSLSGNKYVIQLLDFYEEEDCFYLVMEYCVGGDVFDRIVQYTTYTENDARALAKILLKAVKSIHDTGIAHRDIKPQNLLLLSSDDNALIRVADFGFARRVHTPESLTSRVGTPSYVAPEILKNIPHDQHVDLWSVGVVIFVLLVGYPPFLDDDQTKLFHKIRNGQWVFYEQDWKHISQDAKDLVKGLLVVDPNERWTVEECLRSRWIKQDPAELSCVDLSEALRVLKEKKSRLRSLAYAFMGLGDKIKPAEVATQAQGETNGLSKT